MTEEHTHTAAMKGREKWRNDAGGARKYNDTSRA